MSNNNTAVFGIYHNTSAAESAVDGIVALRFSSSDVSVLLPDSNSLRDFAHEKNTKAPKAPPPELQPGEW